VESIGSDENHYNLAGVNDKNMQFAALETRDSTDCPDIGVLFPK